MRDAAILAAAFVIVVLAMLIVALMVARRAIDQRTRLTIRSDTVATSWLTHNFELEVNAPEENDKTSAGKEPLPREPEAPELPAAAGGGEP